MKPHISGSETKVTSSSLSLSLTAQLNYVKAMSFMTDIWSSEVCPMQGSPTIRRLSVEKNAVNSTVLQVKQCRASHTSK